MVTLSDGTTWPDRNRPDAFDLDGVLAAIDGSRADVIIVEGLFTLAVSKLRERLSTSVFLHLDADLRALRRMLRDMKGGRTSTDPEFIARYYIECARVGHAEFVEPSRQFAGAVFEGDDEGIAEAEVFLLRQVTTEA
jgi:uridine kinase